jgi:ADP-ribosylglycohydrolase
MDSDLIQRAQDYAADAHRDDVRKGTTIPYVSHLWSVAALVWEHGGDDVQVAAALLHDVVEDHGGRTRLEQVRVEFGDAVADLVEAMSDSVADTTAGEAKPPWRPRKERYLARLASADARAALIAACDKLHNARCTLLDLRRDGDRVWERFNAPVADQLWYYRSLVSVLGPRVPPALAEELARTVADIAERTVLSPSVGSQTGDNHPEVTHRLFITEVSALDRAVGALLGLACGDAVGTTLEFRLPGTFEPITDMVGGGPFRLPAGAWTDDTSLALCLAESILDTGGMDLADQLRRYVMWWKDGYLSSIGHCFDIGGATSTQLARFVRTAEPVDPHPDEEAAANGSLMRLAPVPIRWSGDPGEAAERAAESSRTTHPARRPVDACRVLGAMTAALISGAPSEDVFAPEFWRWGGLHPAIEAVARGSWRGKEPPAIRGTGYCLDALEAAIWAVAGAEDFAGAVLRAANLGDDADTTAAIAGQLAGARWGAAGIPVAWREKVVLGPRIVEMAFGLLRAGGGPPPEGWVHDGFLHAWWVEPDRVLAGEYPGDKDPTETSRKVNLLIDAGIRTFVDLTVVDELKPYDAAVAAAARARGLDLRHRRFPIPDLHVLADDDYDPVLDLIREESRRGGVYIHCWGGVGRTGTVVGCLLADDGLGYDAVLDRLAELRAGTRKVDRDAPETGPQLDVIRRRASGTPRPHPSTDSRK